MIYTYKCPHCSNELECEFTPSRPAPACSNHDSPAFSDPGDGAELDIPEECPECEEAIDLNKALEDAQELQHNDSEQPDNYED